MGTPLTDGQTIAVDKSVIPLGSHVYIDGYGERIAEDTGSPSCIYGTNIDVFVDVDHDTCESMGVEYRDVWIK